MSIILSINDPRLEELEYRPGDKFLFKPQSVDEYDFKQFNAIKEERVIVEVAGFMLFDEGDLGYTLNVIEPEMDWVWGLRAVELKEDFVYLGSNYEEARFIFLDE